MIKLFRSLQSRFCRQGLVPVLIAVWLLLSSGSALSFGADGHRIIIAIAENHISEKTAESIHQLIEGADLAKLSLWPDTIRRLPEWQNSKYWHYINVDDDQQLSVVEHDENGHGDILWALQHFSNQLKDPQLGRREQIEALAFLSHLIADIHQPLHVGRQDDRGGNKVRVKWLDQRKTVNLHQVWDRLLISASNKTPKQYARRLDQASDQQITLWQQTEFLDWANQSKALRSQVYDFGTQIRGQHIVLNTAYVERNKPIIERQLLVAGIRLAGCLESIFNPQGL